jgi:glycosyltransferase involved in cell wall biosynthesis
MNVLIVDWLGRGGIAQVTEAWAIELRRLGVEVVVTTRAGRELGAGVVPVDVAPARRGRIASHRAVATHAARLIVDLRPNVVIIQNYVIPALEQCVYRAAATVGAKVVVSVHDHRLHAVTAGTRVGLRRSLRGADTILTHSSFVADAVSSFTGRKDIMQAPLPVQIGIVSEQPIEERPERLDAVALHFGVLRRGYKGTDTVLRLAELGTPGWRFRLLGQGAPAGIAGVDVLPGFVTSETLTAAVAESDATVLPYSFATQSGAIVLAQALGSAVVASRVGGLADQVEEGVSGRLLPANASLDAWQEALVELRDDAARAALVATAYERVWAGHRRFVDTLKTLVG